MRFRSSTGEIGILNKYRKLNKCYVGRVFARSGRAEGTWAEWERFVREDWKKSFYRWSCWVWWLSASDIIQGERTASHGLVFCLPLLRSLSQATMGKCLLIGLTQHILPFRFRVFLGGQFSSFALGTGVKRNYKTVLWKRSQETYCHAS